MRQLPLRTSALSIKTLLCCKLMRAPHPPPPLPGVPGARGSQFATLIDLIESPNRISAIMPYRLHPYTLLTLHLTPYTLHLTPYSLLLTPYSLLLTPYSLLLTPYSLLLTPTAHCLLRYTCLATRLYSSAQGITGCNQVCLLSTNQPAFRAVTV